MPLEFPEEICIDMLNQRDLVMVSCPLPNGTIQTHPYVVLSCKSANDHESSFTGVMMTSSKFIDDQFSWRVSNSMFDKQLVKSDCQIRLHLISHFSYADTNGWAVNRMKRADFDDLLNELFNVTFYLD